MKSLNLILVLLFLVTGVLTTSMVSKPNRWKSLLIVCLLFYYLLVGNKIVVLLLLSGITYVFSHAIYQGRKGLWIPLMLLLIPLIIFKGTEVGHHFESYSLQYADNAAWTNWLTFLQIAGLSYFTFNSISYLIDVKRKYI